MQPNYQFQYHKLVRTYAPFPLEAMYPHKIDKQNNYSLLDLKKSYWGLWSVEDWLTDESKADLQDLRTRLREARESKQFLCSPSAVSVSVYYNLPKARDHLEMYGYPLEEIHIPAPLHVKSGALDNPTKGEIRANRELRWAKWLKGVKQEAIVFVNDLEQLDKILEVKEIKSYQAANDLIKAYNDASKYTLMELLDPKFKTASEFFNWK